MPTKNFYRKANISSNVAISELLKRNPGAEIVEFGRKRASAEEAHVAQSNEGEDIYKAILKHADFPDEGAEDSDDAEAETPEPPVEDSEPNLPSDDSDSEDKPAPKKDESKPSKKPPKEESDSDLLGDSADDDLGEPKKLSPDEEIVHLLRELLVAVKGEGGLGPKSGPEDLDLGGPPPGPPVHHSPLPPPLGGPAGPGAPPLPGVGGGGHHGPPLLPPPVDKGPSGTAFAHYDSTVPEFSVVRKQTSEIGIRGLKAEAESIYPTHRVAKIVTTGFQVIDGFKVNLAENNIAVLTLTAK